MATDAVQTALTVLDRKEHIRRYKRSFALRSAPGTDVGPGSGPDIEARADGDVAMVLYADIATASANTNLIGATGPALLAKAAAVGIDGKLPAAGGAGFVIIAAAENGGTIEAGKVLVHNPSKQRFAVSVTDTYVSGQLCPILGIDVGTATNLPAGTILDWAEDIPGILPTVLVADNGDGLGVGLEGGRPEETDQELIERIIDLRKNPPASGNSAEYRQAARKTPGLAIETVFAYEAVFGPGTIALLPLMRTSSPGGSRIPNVAQAEAVEAQVRNSGFPGDDGIFLMLAEEVPVDVYIAVKFTKAAKPWTNRVPWPPYAGASPVRVSSATSSTQFTLETSSFITDPTVGTVIAFYDSANRRFVRKQISAVTILSARQRWAVTCVSTANASDTSYIPRADVGAVKGQKASPYSESLALLVLPMLTYFKGLGPGETFAVFPDEGTRQKRQPENPEEWPHQVSSRDLGNAPPRAVCSDVAVYWPTPNGLSYDTPIGQPGVLAYLTTLGDFAVFAQ